MKRSFLLVLIAASTAVPSAAGEEDVVGCTSWFGLAPVQTRFTAPSETGAPKGYANTIGISGCSFVATKGGGYHLNPTETDLAAGYWTIRIEREDGVVVYSRDRSPWCADAVIKRGDRVHVWAAVSASAGPASGCR